MDVPAGTYDVELYEMGIRWVMVKYRGLITKEHFVNRVFTASSVHEPTNRIGVETACASQLNPYIAAEQFAINPDWELAEDWDFTSTDHAHHDGQPYRLWALIRPGRKGASLIDLPLLGPNVESGIVSGLIAGVPILIGFYGLMFGRYVQRRWFA